MTAPLPSELMPPELAPFVPSPAFIALAQDFYRVALKPGEALPPHLETERLKKNFAVSLREGLNRLGILGRESGLVLMDEQGVRPVIGQFILQLTGLSDEARDQLIPLLAPEFTRLAALPDLPLPHAELGHDVAEKQIFVRANTSGLRAG